MNRIWEDEGLDVFEDHGEWERVIKTGDNTCVLKISCDEFPKDDPDGQQALKNSDPIAVRILGAVNSFQPPDGQTMPEAIASALLSVDKHSWKSCPVGQDRAEMVHAAVVLAAAYREQLSQIAKKDRALKLALDAFEKNYDVDWNELEEARQPRDKNKKCTSEKHLDPDSFDGRCCEECA